MEVKESPKIREMEEFWKKLWSNRKEHNAEAGWIECEKVRFDETEE